MSLQNPHELSQILRSWSDGKKHVLVHSKCHMNIIKMAEEISDIEILIGSFFDNVVHLAKMRESVGTFIFMLSDGIDIRNAEVYALQILRTVRPDLDIRF